MTEGRRAIVALARSLEPVTPRASLRSRVVASASEGGRYGRYTDRLARLFDVPLDEARSLLRRAEDPANFVPGPVPGTAWLLVTPGPAFAGALAAIGRMAPGAGVPDHIHRGEETTLVLEGGFLEAGTGEEVWRGDELFKPKASEHSFQVIGETPCVAAVIAQGGVKLKR